MSQDLPSMKMYLKFVVTVAVIIGIQGQATNLYRKNYLKDYATNWSSGYLPDQDKLDSKTLCFWAMKEFNAAITSSDPKDSWAITMVDSWGKFKDGWLYGVPQILGAYDQCLRTASPDNTIRGKYCSIWRVPIPDQNSKANSKFELMDNELRWTTRHGREPIAQPFQWGGQSIDKLMKDISYDFLQPERQTTEWNEIFKGMIKHTVNTSLDHRHNGSVGMGQSFVWNPYYFMTYGTCMPHVCTQDQLQDSIVMDWDHNKTQGPWVLFCDEPDWEITLDGVDISFISFCGVIALLMLAGTAAHGYILFTKQEHLAKGPLKFILPFAVSLNLKKIFTINSNPAPGTISCLNGMRVMSMCWVIYGHQNLFAIYALANQNNLYMVDNIWFEIVNNANVSVDSFFFMSGLLVCYGVFREMNKTGSLNIIMYYVHRIIRLTPPIIFVVWWFSTLNRFTVRGPIPFSFSTRPVDLASICRDIGWKDFTYVSNIAFKNNQSIPEGCMGQCWYTSVDTQLYALAPLVLLPLYYYKTIGRVWMYVVTLAAIAMRGFITWNQRNVVRGEDNAWMWDNYFSTWTRVDSWLIGMWTGYFIVNMGKKKLKLKQFQVVAGWTVAVVFSLLVLLGRFHSDRHGTKYIMYEMMFRTVWASCLAWVTIACYFGYGGIVNDFLSHPSWQPFSRLTYPMYLVAQEFTFSYTYSSRTQFYFTHINKIIETCGILFTSTLFALFVSLMIEAPILGLEKLLLKRPGRGAEAAAVGADKKASAPTATQLIGQGAEETVLSAPTPGPVSGKTLPPGYVRHAETFGGSGTYFPATGHDNVAFEPSEKDDIPLKDITGKDSEAIGEQIEQCNQPPPYGFVQPSDSSATNVDHEVVAVARTDSVQPQAISGTQVSVEVEQHNTDPSS